MVKKLMALSALTFVTGIVTTVTPGCSSESSGGGGGGPTDAAPDRDAARPPIEAGPEEDAGECPANIPLTAEELDKDPGWKPAKAAPGACVQADLTKLEANFKDTTLETWFDLGKDVSDPCKACAFSKDTDANWQPIVGTAEDNGKTGFVNFGACFGALEAEACGKAVQFSEFCYNVACNDCATTDTEQRACVSAAGDGMCKAFDETLAKDCPKLQTTAKACGNTILTAIKAICGTGGDGGTDGGDGG